MWWELGIHPLNHLLTCLAPVSPSRRVVHYVPSACVSSNCKFLLLATFLQSPPTHTHTHPTRTCKKLFSGRCLHLGQAQIPDGPASQGPGRQSRSQLQNLCPWQPFRSLLSAVPPARSIFLSFTFRVYIIKVIKCVFKTTQLLPSSLTLCWRSSLLKISAKSCETVRGVWLSPEQVSVENSGFYAVSLGTSHPSCELATCLPASLVLSGCRSLAFEGSFIFWNSQKFFGTSSGDWMLNRGWIMIHIQYA